MPRNITGLQGYTWERAVSNLDVMYIRLGSLWLLVGMGMGIAMGATENFKFAPLHAHINLLGFACHLLFGLAYKQWPEIGRTTLAMAQFWIFTLATPVMAVGLYFTLQGGPAAPTIVGSLGLLIGAALFSLLVWTRAATPALRAGEARA
jgi:hypothetical protein